MDRQGTLWNFIDRVYDGWQKEWVLYLYLCANYYKQEAFNYVKKISEDNGLPEPESIINLLRESDLFSKLSDADTN